MNITVAIPDDIAQRLAASGGDISRRALEAFALEEFREERITQAELRLLLGFSVRTELDAFLKARHVYTDYDLADLEQDRRELDRLGL